MKRPTSMTLVPITVEWGSPHSAVGREPAMTALCLSLAVQYTITVKLLDISIAHRTCDK